MKLDILKFGHMDENCYVLSDEDAKNAVIIDPGASGGKIVDFIKKHDLQVDCILLTHAHSDHIGGIGPIKKELNPPIYLHAGDQTMLENANQNFSAYSGTPLHFSADKTIADGETVSYGNIVIKAIHTPGHTKGGLCFYVEDEGVLFSGDTLFQCSIGRTDFPGGNFNEIVKSIKEKIYTLPDNVKIYPGHGGDTNVQYEKKYNPFVKAH